MPDCLAGDFVGGGLVGAAAVCGELDCFFVGDLPTVRYFRIFSSFGADAFDREEIVDGFEGAVGFPGVQDFLRGGRAMPGTCWSSVAPAVLMLMGWAGGFFLASAAGIVARVSANRAREIRVTESRRLSIR